MEMKICHKFWCRSHAVLSVALVYSPSQRRQVAGTGSLELELNTTETQSLMSARQAKTSAVTAIGLESSQANSPSRRKQSILVFNYKLPGTRLS